MQSQFWKSALTAAALLTLSCAAAAQSPSASTPAGSVIVHSKFGGQIFGFDVDQNGTQGILAEAQTLPNGNVLAAVETFDQFTGRILKVIAKSQTQDDYVTLGIAGPSIALIEREHVVSLLNVVRTVKTMTPLSGDKFTGTWTPPLGLKHIIDRVSRNQSSPTVAVWTLDLTGNFIPTVFSANVAANTFGPVINITDPDFTFADSPVIAYDDQTNQAILAHQTLSPFFVPPVLAVVDLTTGTFNKFTGLGLGIPNGLAVSSSDSIAVTTTELDFSLEFYDLANGFSIIETLPQANNQIQSGTDVEYDPLHKVFLVAQPVSSTSATGSSVHVYDVLGSFVKSINGLNFVDSRFNIEPVHIALNPSRRVGFIDGPDEGFTEIQSFRY
jgi:hypothetical protein